MHLQYNINQLTLNISTDYLPEKNHLVWFIHDLVESLALKNTYLFGRPRDYSLKMLLKLLLFAYARGVFSSRQIQQLAEENLPARWLTQEQVPSYRTICRFRVSEELEEILVSCYDQLIVFLRERKLIDGSLFIDGTKLLADANKYSFVWKKNTLRYDTMNRQQLEQLLEELKAAYTASHIPEDTPLSLEQLEEVMTRLELRLEEVEETVKKTEKISPNPAKHTRRRLKSLRRKLLQRLAKRAEHQAQLATFNGRNSYSKTDPDATFMRMKDDPMRNGQLKPGYNLQLATSNQYVLAYQLFPNPTDTRTLIPFFQSHQSLIQSVDTVSLDAGYGSESNYRFLEDNFPHLTALIPYGTYLKEQSRKWQSDERKVMNWDYDEADDYYIDPQGVRFNFKAYRQQTDQYGMTRSFKEYEAEKYTADQEVIPQALTPKGYTRKVRINPSWEYFKAQQREKLSDTANQQIYSRRKIDVESVFGHLKACLKFTRFSVRGQDKVHREMGLALMALNVRKYTRHLKQKEDKQNRQGLSAS